jgi:surface antigen
MRNILAVAFLTGLLLGGCADLQNNPKQGVGTLAGAAAGGLLGAQFGGGTGQLAATGAGVLLGGLLGSEVGRSLDRADRLAMQQTTQSTLETGRTGVASQWRNPDTGNYGTVTPLRTTEANGTVCREYQQTISMGGQAQEGYGTACRQPDGTWRIVR